ncbi:hypothetical protein LY78DRAFT_91162 [Colletotrichum sublineola]|nr:hypothetical protein LY78DRAFT_91162 [Colletotrichum sublineola]
MFPRSVNMGPPTFALLRRFPTRRSQGPFHELLSRGGPIAHPVGTSSPLLTTPIGPVFPHTATLASAVTHRINTGPKARPPGMRVASTLGRVCCQILLKFRKELLALRSPLWYSPVILPPTSLHVGHANQRNSGPYLLEQKSHTLQLGVANVQS